MQLLLSRFAARQRRQHAFTLIELLVVILIIGILIAVAAPSFFGQSEKAHVSALKQQEAVAYRAARAASVGNTPQDAYSTGPTLATDITSSEPQLSGTVSSNSGVPATAATVDVGDSTPSQFCAVGKTSNGTVVAYAAPNNGSVSVTEGASFDASSCTAGLALPAGVCPTTGAPPAQPGTGITASIQGNEGWFRIGCGAHPNPAGPYTNSLPSSPEYTQTGSFQLDIQGFLVVDGGEYVIGRNAVANGTAPNITYTPGMVDTYVNIPPGASGVQIGSDGAVSYLNASSTRVTAAYISLAGWPGAPYDQWGDTDMDGNGGLEKLSDGFYGNNTSLTIVGTPGVGGFGSLTTP